MSLWLFGFLWWLGGFAGCWLVWLDDRRWRFNDLGQARQNPTPRAVLLATFCAAVGPMVLGAGIVLSVIGIINEDASVSWWTRPFGGKQP